MRVIKEFLDPLVEGALEVKRGREEKGLPLEGEEGSFLEYMVAGTDGTFFALAAGWILMMLMGQIRDL